MKLPPLVRALRPHHWVKNLLVFVPVLVGHQADDPARVAEAALTFVAFCLAASGGYVLNDLADVERDRAHRTRRTRPFAARELAPRTGWLVAPLLLGAALATAALARNAAVALAVGAYIALGLSYSLALRGIRFVDVGVLTGLYLIRIVAGGYASDTPASPWLLAFSAAFFLGLALLKRTIELRGEGGLAGRGYTARDAPAMQTFGLAAGAASAAVLAAYATSDAARLLYARPAVLWLAAVLVLLWILRVWKLAGQGEVEEDPVLFATRDPVTWLVGVAVLALLVYATPA